MDDLQKYRRALRFHGLALPDIPKHLTEVGLDALYYIANYWRRNIAPRHFEHMAFSIYGGHEERVYERRTNKYWAKKLRRGINEPLVWSGTLRHEFLKGTYALRSSGQGNQIRITAKWPNLPPHAYYTNFGKDSTPGPRMYRELTITTPEEEKKLAEIYAKKFSELLVLKQIESATGG